MTRTAVYHTTVHWKGEHWGHIRMGNGPEMDFSAPPDAHGHAGVLTPEDAFVAAVNTCVMMMFIWATERFKLDLVSYECAAEGTKRIELDRTEIFTRVALASPDRRARGCGSIGRDAEACAAGSRERGEVQPRREFDQVGNRRRTPNRNHCWSRRGGLRQCGTTYKEKSMTAKSVGFIGGGRVAHIILGGLKKAGQMPGNVVVSDISLGCPQPAAGEVPGDPDCSQRQQSAGRPGLGFCGTASAGDGGLHWAKSRIA